MHAEHSPLNMCESCFYSNVELTVLRMTFLYCQIIPTGLATAWLSVWKLSSKFTYTTQPVMKTLIIWIIQIISVFSISNRTKPMKCYDITCFSKQKTKPLKIVLNCRYTSEMGTVVSKVKVCFSWNCLTISSVTHSWFCRTIAFLSMFFGTVMENGRPLPDLRNSSVAKKCVQTTKVR